MIAYIIYIFNFITFLLQFLFRFKISVVETLVVMNKVSQVVLFIPIQLSRILRINTIIHTYKINYYCHCCFIAGHKFYCTSNTIPIESPMTMTWKNERCSMFWHSDIRDHYISENNHINEPPGCNAYWRMNQNSSNEMTSASLSS